MHKKAVSYTVNQQERVKSNDQALRSFNRCMSIVGVLSSKGRVPSRYSARGKRAHCLEDSVGSGMVKKRTRSRKVANTIVWVKQELSSHPPPFDRDALYSHFKSRDKAFVSCFHPILLLYHSITLHNKPTLMHIKKDLKMFDPYYYLKRGDVRMCRTMIVVVPHLN